MKVSQSQFVNQPTERLTNLRVDICKAIQPPREFIDSNHPQNITAEQDLNRWKGFIFYSSFFWYMNVFYEH